MLVVCMLNPSTADADANDPTILTLIHFGKLWGYGGIFVVNEKAYRSSSPAEMQRQDDPRGPDNGRSVKLAVRYARDNKRPVLAAWGNGGTGKLLTELAYQEGVPLICLGTTQDGSPKHPLARGVHRIPRDQQPIAWSPR